MLTAGHAPSLGQMHKCTFGIFVHLDNRWCDDAKHMNNL